MRRRLPNIINFRIFIPQGAAKSSHKCRGDPCKALHSPLSTLEIMLLDSALRGQAMMLQDARKKPKENYG